jgi:hypothetical protein
MNTSADVSKFKRVPVHVKCCILLKPVRGAELDFPVLFIKRLNRTEPAIFSRFPLGENTHIGSDKKFTVML